MIALPTYHFHGLTLRQAEEADLKLAKAWTEADPAHSETAAEWWTKTTLLAKCFLLLDVEGPVFFFRMAMGLEGGDDLSGVKVYIQFSPEDLREPGPRARAGLLNGFEWLQKLLAPSDFHAIYFDTKNPKLAYYCRRHLGFLNTGRRTANGSMVLKRAIAAAA